MKCSYPNCTGIHSPSPETLLAIQEAEKELQEGKLVFYTDIDEFMKALISSEL